MATRGTTGEITSLESRKEIEVRSNEQTVQCQNKQSGKIIALTPNALSYYLAKGKMKGSSVRLKEVHMLTACSQSMGEIASVIPAFCLILKTLMASGPFALPFV